MRGLLVSVIAVALGVAACGDEGVGEPVAWGLSLDCPSASWSSGWQPTEERGVLAWDCVGVDGDGPLGPFADVRADGAPVRYGSFDASGRRCGLWVDAVENRTWCFEGGRESAETVGVSPETECPPCDYANPGGS